MSEQRFRFEPYKTPQITITPSDGNPPYSYAVPVAWTAGSIGDTVKQGSGGGYCLHYRVEESVSGSFGKSPTLGDVSVDDFFDPRLFSINLPGLGGPSFNDLMGGNNEFELLPFMAEIDDTIASFSLKFLRSLLSKSGYGAFTWGVLPFISDLRALLQSLKDLMSQGEPQTQEVNRVQQVSYSVETKASILRCRAHYSGSVRMHGLITVQLPSLGGLEYVIRLLDELGVHPDLGTVWDLIPFSFVVDYFLPIGDYLQSIHPRGWGSYAATFTGWRSYSLEVSGECMVPGCPKTKRFRGHIYYREKVTGPVGLTPEGVEWKSPSLKELFNTAYLSTSIRNMLSRLGKR